MKDNKRNLVVAGLSLAMGLAAASSAFAGPYASLGTVVPTGGMGTIVPDMVAGAPPDSPAARVDPNTTTSPFSGVVSINIRYDNKSFICTGTLVSKRDVVSAGHCVDTDGNGHVIDVSQPFATSGKDVRVVFNAGPGAANQAVVTADAVYMNPFYQGFGNCPAAVNPPSFCVNDDISVIHMNADAPAAAQIYSVLAGAVTTGQLDTMTGYGLTGNGVTGYDPQSATNPSFRIKRTGQNIMDLFDTNDEQNFAGNSPKEVWYADFDGNGQDTFCNNPAIIFPPVCTPQLANNVETMLGGGDSGGPSFYHAQDGQYWLMGNNTFSGNLNHSPTGQFGDYSGGILLASYVPWLQEVTSNRIALVPEPSTYALLFLALGLMGFVVRRNNG